MTRSHLIKGFITALIVLCFVACSDKNKMSDSNKQNSADERRSEKEKQRKVFQRPTLDAPLQVPTPDQLSALLAATEEIEFSGKYDDAEWHYGGQYPDDVPVSHGFTHIGFFLAWAAERDLLSEYMHQETGDVVASIRRRDVEPVRLLEVWDGILVDDMLSDEANDFTRQYYSMEMSERTYNIDYANVFGDENIYRVEPSWDNYDKLKPVLDDRFNEWRAAEAKEKE